MTFDQVFFLTALNTFCAAVGITLGGLIFIAIWNSEPKHQINTALVLIGLLALITALHARAFGWLKGLPWTG